MLRSVSTIQPVLSGRLVGRLRGLVKPLNVRYNQKPLNIDSDRLKTCMWSVISTKLAQNSANSVLFSEVHAEIQKRYKPDKNEIIPQQLSFVILLILANLKVCAVRFLFHI
ncbi:hypothetical protein AVEN_116960-1 [Araneus ventricosus]|uniref:Uncharacterized protein n=1 Tax=Araneus ventricosus TaxID=182803 RepID=A0A4Y2N7S0_ARAVE|nr:hypothetical protein AVEN_116960-1 [Araneus ventricosus]